MINMNIETKNKLLLPHTKRFERNKADSENMKCWLGPNPINSTNFPIQFPSVQLKVIGLSDINLVGLNYNGKNLSVYFLIIPPIGL